MLSVVDQIDAGLLGGLAAGYPTSGTFGNSAWNGLAMSSVSGIVVMFFTALFGSLLGLAGGPLGGLLGGVDVLIAGVVLALIFATDSAIAGAAGAWVKG